MTERKDDLGVDFDDMVFDFNEEFRKYHNKYYGTSYEFSHIWTYDMAKFLQLEEEEKNRRVVEFYNSAEHAAGEPVEGALEALEILSKKYVLHIVSARPEHMREFTEAWLGTRDARRFFENVHLTNAYLTPDGTIARSKVEVCREIHAAAHLEDALHHAKAVSAAGIPVYLLDKPWNQSKPIPGVTRVRDWNEIVKALTEHESAPAI